jgi:hypothetical protein
LLVDDDSSSDDSLFQTPAVLQKPAKKIESREEVVVKRSPTQEPAEKPVQKSTEKSAKKPLVSWIGILGNFK